MKITIVAAADADWGIGLEGRLPWHCPEDMKRFRSRTIGAALVMGRRTAESVGHHLPHRTIITVSTTGMSVQDAIEEARESGFSECFLAGGRAVYEAGLTLADGAEITRMQGRHRCDVRMPDLVTGGWSITDRLPLSDTATVEFWKPSSPQR